MMHSDANLPHIIHFTDAGTCDAFRRYLENFGPAFDFKNLEATVEKPGYIVSGEVVKKFPPAYHTSGVYNHVFKIQPENFTEQLLIIVRTKSPKSFEDIVQKSFVALFNPRYFLGPNGKKTFSLGPEEFILWYSKAQLRPSRKRPAVSPVKSSGSCSKSLRLSPPKTGSSAVAASSLFLEANRDFDRLQMPPPPSWIDCTRKRPRNVPSNVPLDDPGEMSSRASRTGGHSGVSHCAHSSHSHCARSTCSNHQLSCCHKAPPSCCDRQCCHNSRCHGCQPSRTCHEAVCSSRGHFGSCRSGCGSRCCNDTRETDCHGSTCCSKHHFHDAPSRVCSGHGQYTVPSRSTAEQQPRSPQPDWFVRNWVEQSVIENERTVVAESSNPMHAPRDTQATYGDSFDVDWNDDNWSSISEQLEKRKPDPTKKQTQTPIQAGSSSGAANTQLKLPAMLAKAGKSHQNNLKPLSLGATKRGEIPEAPSNDDAECSSPMILPITSCKKGGQAAPQRRAEINAEPQAHCSKALPKPSPIQSSSHEPVHPKRSSLRRPTPPKAQHAESDSDSDNSDISSLFVGKTQSLLQGVSGRSPKKDAKPPSEDLNEGCPTSLSDDVCMGVEPAVEQTGQQTSTEPTILTCTASLEPPSMPVEVTKKKNIRRLYNPANSSWYFDPRNPAEKQTEPSKEPSTDLSGTQNTRAEQSTSGITKSKVSADKEVSAPMSGSSNPVVDVTSQDTDDEIVPPSDAETAKKNDVIPPSDVEMPDKSEPEKLHNDETVSRILAFVEDWPSDPTPTTGQVSVNQSTVDTLSDLLDGEGRSKENSEEPDDFTGLHKAPIAVAASGLEQDVDKTDHLPEESGRDGKTLEDVCKPDPTLEDVERANENVERTDQTSEEILQADQTPEEIVKTDQTPEEVVQTDNTPEEIVHTDHTPEEIAKPGRMAEGVAHSDQVPENVSSRCQNLDDLCDQEGMPKDSVNKTVAFSQPVVDSGSEVPSSQPFDDHWVLEILNETTRGVSGVDMSQTLCGTSAVDRSVTSRMSLTLCEGPAGEESSVSERQGSTLRPNPDCVTFLCKLVGDSAESANSVQADRAPTPDDSLGAPSAAEDAEKDTPRGAGSSAASEFVLRITESTQSEIDKTGGVNKTDRRSPDSTTEHLSEENLCIQVDRSASPASTVFYDAEARLEDEGDQTGVRPEDIISYSPQAKECDQDSPIAMDNADVSYRLSLPDQVFGVYVTIVNMEPSITPETRADIVRGVCVSGCKSKFEYEKVTVEKTVIRRCTKCSLRRHHICPKCKESGQKNPLCLKFFFEIHALIGSKCLRLQVEKEEAVNFLGIDVKHYLKQGSESLPIVRSLENLSDTPDEKKRRLEGQVYIRTEDREGDLVPLLVDTRLSDFKLSKRAI